MTVPLLLIDLFLSRAVQEPGKPPLSLSLSLWGNLSIPISFELLSLWIPLNLEKPNLKIRNWLFWFSLPSFYKYFANLGGIWIAFPLARFSPILYCSLCIFRNLGLNCVYERFVWVSLLLILFTALLSGSRCSNWWKSGMISNSGSMEHAELTTEQVGAPVQSASFALFVRIWCEAGFNLFFFF